MNSIKKYNVKKPTVIDSPIEDLYSYKVYVGKHTIVVEQGDSAWVVTEKEVKCIRGPIEITSDKMCVVIRGYASDNRSSGYQTVSNLPYVNGCSSNQLISPTRLGDPTAQLLYLPPHTSEQAHHIHSTARVVYVLKGKGKSIQGMKGHTKGVKLKEGDVIVLDKMAPHHFETKGNELLVIPIHVYSSTQMEFNHPMMNGTHVIEN